jgi:hypothetical protein
MAKILFGAFVTDMRRKIAGNVFTKNRYGAMVRQKVTPRNPKTEPQSTSRSIFSAVSAQWRNLTDIQRNAWSAFAATISAFDVFRVANVLTGQVAYVKLNTLLKSAGLPGLSEPPTTAILDTPFVVSSIDFEPDGIPVTITTPDGQDVFTQPGYLYLVDATQQLSAGIMTRTHGFARITNSPTIQGNVNILSPYVAKFGELIPGRKIFLRIRALQIATGAVSIPIYTNFVVPEGTV